MKRSRSFSEFIFQATDDLKFLKMVCISSPTNLDIFLEIIAANDYHALKKFIDENPEEIDSFVDDNVQVLKVALQNQNLAIYTLLLSEGFSICNEDTSEKAISMQTYLVNDEAEENSEKTAQSVFGNHSRTSIGPVHERHRKTLNKTSIHKEQPVSKKKKCKTSKL